jgi:RNA polymerase sigma-70 factor (ECF subfamily)
MEPYPDEQLGLADGLAGPEARYEQRESIELAFIAALQHLPANQRAVLIMREVLGFSAREVADSLETTTASVNSALQRARKTAAERLPAESQQAALRSLGDNDLRKTVDGYVEAWNRGDVEAVVAMLSEDASFAMPPLKTWFGGRDAIAVFLAGWPLSGLWRWRQVRVRASGQEALAFYTWDEDQAAYLPFALNILAFRGALISEVTAFLTRSTLVSDRDALARLPEQPADPMRLTAAFERFGLPDRLS